MSNSIGLGIFDYINIWPVYYDFLFGKPPADFQLIYGNPAELNRRLEKGELHASCISSAAYPLMKETVQLVPTLGLVSDGPVQSVLLLTSGALEETVGRKIYITKASATAAILLQIILRLKNIQAEIIASDSPFNELNRPGNSALVIGNEALNARLSYPNFQQYDLGELWWQFTRAPFVWAVWGIHRKALLQGTKICETLFASREHGIKHLSLIAEAAAFRLGIKSTIIESYLQNFRYTLNEEALKSLNLFYQLGEKFELLSPKKELLLKASEMPRPSSQELIANGQGMSECRERVSFRDALQSHS